MPKQVHRITDFGGGINSIFDATDIAQNESVEIINLMVDKRGKVRRVGRLKTVDIKDLGIPTAGYGLYTFHTDYRYSASYGTANNFGEDWVAFGNNTGDVWLYHKSGTRGWEKLYSASVSADTKFGFYYARGALRIYDPDKNNVTKWWGYIDRTNFKDASSVSTNTWYLTDAICYSPKAGTFGTSVEPSEAEVVNVNLDTGSGTGILWDKTWECAVSFEYDGNQESLLTKLSGTVTLTESDATADITVTIKADGSTNKWNPRITAINVYLREVDTDDWFLQARVEMDSGAESVIATKTDKNARS